MDRLGVAVSITNYRRFLAGLFVSMLATWMHAVALAWVIVERGGGGLALGVVAALQFGPILLLGPLGGLLADRMPKQRLLIISNMCAAAAALVLTVAEFADRTSMPIIYATSLGLGIANAVDNPTRRAFISEMVPPAAIQSAVSLQTAATTLSRVVGPLLAGLLIAVGGPAPSFAANAGSFLAFAVMLATIRPHELTPTIASRGPHQLRLAVSHALHDRDLFVPLAMTFTISVLTWEHEVVLPFFAAETFEGSAWTLAFLFAALSVGNVTGALYSATRETSHRDLKLGAVIVAVGMAAAALAPLLPVALIALAVAGGGFAIFFSTANALLQRNAPPAMRGRIMALMSMVFLGGRPIGGPIIGAVIEIAGPRAALMTGAFGALAATAFGRRSRSDRSSPPA
jgi:MFS family permease